MSRWRPGIPEELERIVFKCLEKRPAHRYQDAGELKADLQATPSEVLEAHDKPALEANPPRAESAKLHPLPDSRHVSPLPLPEAGPQKSSLPKQSKRWLAFATAAVLVLVAATAGLMWLSGNRDAVRPPADGSSDQESCSQSVKPQRPTMVWNPEG